MLHTVEVSFRKIKLNVIFIKKMMSLKGNKKSTKFLKIFKVFPYALFC